MKKGSLVVVASVVAFLAGYLVASGRGRGGSKGAGIPDLGPIGVHVPYQDSPDRRSGHTLDVYLVEDGEGRVLVDKFQNGAPRDSAPVWRVDVGGLRYYGTVR